MLLASKDYALRGGFHPSYTCTLPPYTANTRAKAASMTGDTLLALPQYLNTIHASASDVVGRFHGCK